MKKILFALTVVITLSILFTPAVSFAGKEEARDVATGATVLGGVAIVAPEPASTGAGMAVCGIEGISLVGMGIWNWWEKAFLSADVDHGEEATVTAVVFTPVSGSDPLIDSINASLVCGGKLINDSRLVMISLEKYYGAVDAEHTANTELQLNATVDFLHDLEDSMLNYRISLTAISANIYIDPNFANLSVTVADVIAERDRVISEGNFPSYEDFVFTEMNATPDEMDHAIIECELLTGTHITDADLTGAVIFDRLAEALGKVDFRELLPADFVASVSSPSYWETVRDNAIVVLDTVTGHKSPSQERDEINKNWDEYYGLCALPAGQLKMDNVCAVANYSQSGVGTTSMLLTYSPVGPGGEEEDIWGIIEKVGYYAIPDLSGITEGSPIDPNTIWEGTPVSMTEGDFKVFITNSLEPIGTSTDPNSNFAVPFIMGGFEPVIFAFPTIGGVEITADDPINSQYVAFGSTVASCSNELQADLNFDCEVNLFDFALLVLDWLDIEPWPLPLPPSPTIPPVPEPLP